MVVLYQNEQVRELESAMIESGAATAADLMATAGMAAFNYLRQRWPAAQRIAVICGKGNNAGDALVLARLAHQEGLAVTVYSLFKINELSGLSKVEHEICDAASVNLCTYTPDMTINADVIVDGLLGSGLQGEVRTPLDHCIQQLNQSGIAILALDVPSGLDGDTGAVHGCAIKASATITFIGYSPGLLTNKGPDHCGALHCDDLGIPKQIYAAVTPVARTIELNEINKLLPKRNADYHKGSCGHVLIIGGDYGMGGAVRMAAEAAMRVGAGLVTVATRPEHVAVVNCSRPEIMCHQVSTAADLEPLLATASVIVIGPGLGKTDWAKELLNKVLESKLPKLLDADALNLLAQQPQSQEDWVLTPHPGEAGRLLDISTSQVQQDRLQAAQQLQQQYGGVLVLKGVGSIVCDAATIQLCTVGNPGMATGGMGDVLSGVIGGLMAQGLTCLSAAQAGVLLHATAADLAAAKGGERGLLATDLMDYLRALVNPGQHE